MEIILASASPRRKELLCQAGFSPKIVIPNVDESMKKGESISAFLKRVAIEKSLSIGWHNYPEALIISADTIVVVNDCVLGKPQSNIEAHAFLKLLSGKKHEVRTGLALFYRGEISYCVSRTAVFFDELSDTEINNYIKQEQVLDKAGAYAIQGRAALFVQKINGCYFNVMGFPLNLFYRMTKKIGIQF